MSMLSISIPIYTIYWAAPYLSIYTMHIKQLLHRCELGLDQPLHVSLFKEHAQLLFHRGDGHKQIAPRYMFSSG